MRWWRLFALVGSESAGDARGGRNCRVVAHIVNSRVEAKEIKCQLDGSEP